MAQVYIALGSNLGNPVQKIDQAVLEIGAHKKISIVKLSRLYKSKPHGSQGQPDFVNAVLLVETSLTPELLLVELQKIENRLGRVRSEVWGPRLIDLDIIVYDDIVMNTPTLTIPHAHMSIREFVLYPLYDLDKQLVLPIHGKLSELVEKVNKNNLKVIRDGTTYHH